MLRSKGDNLKIEKLKDWKISGFQANRIKKEN